MTDRNIPTDDEVERIAEGVARGIQRAEEKQWRLEAWAAANPPPATAADWIGMVLALVALAGFLWWAS